MKKSIYITLALAGILSMNSCNDDEFLPGNPSINPVNGCSKLLIRIKAIRQPGPMYGKAASAGWGAAASG